MNAIVYLLVVVLVFGIAVKFLPIAAEYQSIILKLVYLLVGLVVLFVLLNLLGVASFPSSWGLRTVVIP